MWSGMSRDERKIEAEAAQVPRNKSSAKHMTNTCTA
jgi:hypothetical protein